MGDHDRLETAIIIAWSAHTKTIGEVMSPLEHVAVKLKEIRPPN